MAPPTQSELNNLAMKAQETLSRTPYACSSIHQLLGGTTSFVFRGSLTHPLTSNNETMQEVIIKHAEGFISCEKEFGIEASRCEYEALLLAALKDFTPVSSLQDNIMVKTPEFLFFDSMVNLLVTQYIPNTLTLKKGLPSLSTSQASSIGFALGSWLRSFHSWTSAPSQNDLKEKVNGNLAMRDLKWKITYEQGGEKFERFADVVGEEGMLLWEDIKVMAKSELEKNSGEGWGVVHGDFWTGNVLLPATKSNQSLRDFTLHIIDFEFTQRLPLYYDLGQFLGDLLETHHFNPSLPIPSLISGFINGYGRISKELAFRTALHTGVHIVNWWSRGPYRPRSEEGMQLVSKAWDIVEKSWKKDEVWFKEQMLGELFD